MAKSHASLLLVILGIFIASIFSAAGFSKAFAQSGKENSIKNDPSEKVTNLSSSTSGEVLSAEEEKVSRVLSLMGDRARKEISFIASNKKEFVLDILSLLEEEKTFRSDDKSFFFLVDKKHLAEKTYIPKDLVSLETNALFDVNKGGMQIRREAFASLSEMAKASLDDGVRLLVGSAYRSYDYQEKLFNYWVSVDGLEEAERESAIPGTSQHQLGMVIDFGSISDDFAETDEEKWLSKNAASFGWSLSFPKGYEDVTGYRWECWHFRYIGKNACRIQDKWFCGIQQFMLEFLDLWKKIE